MARHRAVRSKFYGDDIDYDEDLYGQSAESDPSTSPSNTRFMYDRSRNNSSLAAFISNNDDIQEHADEDCPEGEDTLYDLDEDKFKTCIEAVRETLGDEIPPEYIAKSCQRYDYDIARVMNDVLCFQENKASSSTRKKKEKLEKNRPRTLTVDVSKQKPGKVITVSAAPHQSIFNAHALKLEQSPHNSERSSPNLFNTTEDGITNEPRKVVISKQQAQRNAQELYAKERADKKEQFNLIVIGHVDAGKSTLMGHLLYDSGYVTERQMHKHKVESQQMHKQSFMYAWVLDETEEERSRGVTMDIAQTRFETATKSITLLDAPGHKDFIPNMIAGATQADVALLVVDATRGEFETGFDLGGQTREHAILVRSLGVNQLSVVVNKMDTVGWSKERFDEIVNKLNGFLKQIGFKLCDVSYVPCSGLTGVNLCKPAADEALKTWYNGPTLLEVIDAFKPPVRSIEKPLRFCVFDIYQGVNSVPWLTGRVETGVMCVNDKVLVGETRELATIKSLTLKDVAQQSVFAGDLVAVALADVDISTLAVGCVICDPQKPVPLSKKFQARILIFNTKIPIIEGYPVLIHVQSLSEQGNISKLTASIDKQTGAVIKKKPRFLGNNTCALVDIETARAICIERFADFKELGRVMLRVNGVTIAAGMITKIKK